MFFRNTRLSVVFTLLVVVLTAAAVAGPGQSETASDERYVTAIGKAAGTDLRAQDRAKLDAKRNAVEQACGAIINAQSEVEDFQLFKDRILSNAVGYITGFDIKREWTADGIAHCEIAAHVAIGRFESDWAAMFAHIREDMANPRCVIVITEDNDVDDQHPPKLNGICQSKIENYFLHHGVQLMDKGVTEDVRSRDADLAALNGDVNALAARAAAFSADVLFYGRAEAKGGGAIEIGGHTVYRWDVTLNVRAVQADSAQMLVSNTYRPNKPYQSTSAACGDDAFARLADDVAGQILHDIAEAWRKGLTSHHIFRLQIEGCSRKDFRRQVAPALAAVRGVQQGEEGVKLREAVNNVIVAEVYWAYDLNSLADAVEDLEVEGMAFDVVEQTANRIRCRVTPLP